MSNNVGWGDFSFYGLVDVQVGGNVYDQTNQRVYHSAAAAPTSVAGPPGEPGYVPRKLRGACGSLWDALRYEKGIELLGMSGVITLFDARGWQTMAERVESRW